MVKFTVDFKKTLCYGLLLLMLLVIFSTFLISCGSVTDETETVDEVEIVIFEPKEEYVPVYTEYKSEESEEYLWNKLSEYSPADHITAGVLGYFKRESELRSDCISNWHTSMAAAGEDVSITSMVRSCPCSAMIF